MIRMSRRLTALFLTVILAYCFSFTALAADNEAASEGYGTTAVFDLKDKSEQVYTYFDTEGNKITIGIKPAKVSIHSSEPWSEGTWDIYVYGPLSAYYKIDISSKGKITDAYDEGYTAIGVTVNSDSLSYTSSKATYKLTYKIPDPLPDILGASGSLYAKISGSNLVVTNTIY
ncbi:DUF5626 family protein [Clostridium sp. Marseille-P2415]|uniref:DUF5626 family protein n=1 Tax=Clostridium sp. Marseille-P2415 TaxID=1805471 RepID=UPI00098894E1|nr:DUF5626 family protein [Clostridium sp. Marseille-P2415]